MTEEKEIENLFNKLVYGTKRFDELYFCNIKDLLNSFNDKRDKLDKIEMQLIENVENEIGANDKNVGEQYDGHPN